MDVTKTNAVLNEVLAEREKQTAKWGEQNHKIAKWGLILGEEVGEFNEAALEATAYAFPSSNVLEFEKWAEGARAELVQVAAVAVSIVEAIDRMGTEKIFKD